MKLHTECLADRDGCREIVAFARHNYNLGARDGAIVGFIFGAAFVAMIWALGGLT
jgi:hypothetical protein